MPVESWIAPDDVPALAAEAKARIDAALCRLDEAERASFWASIRKCYNTPYNDPKPRKLVRSEVVAARPAGVATVPPLDSDIAALVAMAPHAGFSPEHHVG
jgi:hypothetical protein